nr:MAG TPA: Baseplate hub subunit [Caudoviricetes sp.]
MNDALTSFRGIRKDAEENPLDKLNKLDSLDSLQAATELVAETVEQKSNEVVGAVEDNTAANELTAENTQSTADNTQKTYEELKKLNNFSSQMNEKLRGFGVMMERRFGVVSKMASGIGAIEEALKKPEQPQTMPSPQPVLPTVPEQPNNDNYQNLPKKKPDQEEKKKKKKELDKDSLENLVKVVRGGFKETVGISNKILGMLFKITLTAMAEAAKWGAIMLGIVLAIDTILVHFRHWSNLFDTDFKGFMKQAGTWGPTISKILKTVENVRDYWKNGEYSKLIVALVDGIGNAFYRTFIQLDRIVTSAIAGVLRMIPGMGDYADRMEYGAIKAAQEHGYKATEEEKEMMFRVEEKDRQDRYGERSGFMGEMRNVTESIGDGIRDGFNSIMVKTGFKDQKDVDAEKRKDELARQEHATTTKEQRRASSDLSKDVTSELNRATLILKDLDSDDKTQMKDLRDQVNVYREQLNSPILVESDRTELERLVEKFDEIYAAKTQADVSAKSVPVAETEVAKQTERTENLQRQANVQQQTTNQQNNVNNTQVITNNKTIKQGAPTTRIDAPGTIQMGNF